MSKFKREETAARALLNEPVITSVLVAPINTFSFTKEMGKHLFGQAVGGLIPLGGAVGGAISGAATGAVTGVAEAVTGRKKERERSMQLLPHMLLIVGQTQIALIEFKQGFFRNSLGQILFCAPKKDVTKFDVGVKTKSPLAYGIALELAGGIRIELESHWRLKKHCNAVKSALNQ